MRDVAALRMGAVTRSTAAGERCLGVAGDFVSPRDIAMVRRRRRGAGAKRMPTRRPPNWLVRLAALRDPAVRQFLPELGKLKNATGENAGRLLGWALRSNEEAIVATAESLVRLGLLKHGPTRLPEPARDEQRAPRDREEQGAARALPKG